MAAHALDLLADAAKAQAEMPTPELKRKLAKWISDSGAATLHAYRKLTPQQRRQILEYLAEFSLYEEVRAGGMQIARQFAADLGVTLLLKSNTSIVTDGKRAALNTEGCPALARGGSGDVLAGILCAILARGVAPFEGAAAAAHLLGRAGVLAAEKSNEYSPLASDVIAHIPQAITQLMRGQA